MVSGAVWELSWSYLELSGSCLGAVWELSGSACGCVGDVALLPVGALELGTVRELSGRCLGSVRELSGSCLECGSLGQVIQSAKVSSKSRFRRLLGASYEGCLGYNEFEK